MSEHVVVIAELDTLIGRADDVRALLEATQERARAEPGCLMYAFAELVGEPGRFVLVEEWRDQAALDAHFASATFADYQQRIGEFLAQPTRVAFHHVRATLRPGDPGPMDPRRAD